MNLRRSGEELRVFLTGALVVLAGSLGAAAAAEPSLNLVKKIVLKGTNGKLDHLTVDSKGQRLSLANKINNTVDIVDLKAGRLLRQLPGQSGAQGLAYAADLDRLYVALGTGGYCNIFDADNYKLLKTVKFMDDADNVRYNPRTHLVYVAHAEKALGVIDAKNFEIKADIELPGSAEGFQLDSKRPRLYLCSPTPSELIVIDTAKYKVLKRYPIKRAGGGHPVALDEAHHRIFIGCRKKPMVVVMDMESGKEITSVDIPADVDDLYYDAKRKALYASCGEGSLVIIRQQDKDSYKKVQTIKTAKDARTCFFDPRTSRLYLGVPRQKGKKGPEIWVYQVR
jgi:DNA-binding beta-propeller fold protein YncE